MTSKKVAAGSCALLALAAALFAGAAHKERQPAAVKPADHPAGKPAVEVLRQRLSPEQFYVTQQSGTEAPFQNAYWNQHADGLYVDVVSQVPLFSSLDKYDSGTGWPSFTRPLHDDHLVSRTDRGLGATRTEVRSAAADSHLGHVFDDGPGPGGKRYCMNSAALRFIPVEELQAAGLGRYLFAFAERRHWDIATLAGGCFWGMEEFFRKRPGVLATQVGYTGGKLADPTYADICTGSTGHAEAVQVLFDPQKVGYEDLLLYFFKIHDPTTQNQQGNDRGTQYRSAIFFRDKAQQQAAAKVLARVQGSAAYRARVKTELAPLAHFFVAEPEHQDYLEKHPGGYSCHFERPVSF